MKRFASLRPSIPSKLGAGVSTSRVAPCLCALLIASVGVQCTQGGTDVPSEVEAEVLALVTAHACSRELGRALPLDPRYNGARMVRFDLIDGARSRNVQFIEQHFGPESLGAARAQLRSNSGRRVSAAVSRTAGDILRLEIPTTSDESSPHFSISRLYWREDLQQGLIYFEDMTHPSEGSGWLLVVTGTVGNLKIAHESLVFF